MDDRLSKHDMSPEGGCSAAFKKLLTDFVNSRVVLMRNTRRALKLDEDHTEQKDISLTERIAANISGISSKQLQVCIATSFVFI